MGGKRDAGEEMEAGNRARGAVARSERERGPEGSISRTARREGEVQIHEAARGLMCSAQRDAVYGRCGPESEGQGCSVWNRGDERCRKTGEGLRKFGSQCIGHFINGDVHTWNQPALAYAATILGSRLNPGSACHSVPFAYAYR
jgi:hypothetical protein